MASADNIEERLKAALADRYQIEREIGSGGMATVYLAEDLRHRRKVAIKVLRPDLAAILGRDRFIREIEIAAALSHPHILPLHDSGEIDGFFFYVMPHVEGESLRDRLTREGRLPIQAAVRILREVADALSEAHVRDVVHRDIKPANILLSGRHALVADFGVAKALSDATSRHELTTAGVALGTPSYMAPEQAAADAQTDHRADVFALGVVAYEMLAGRAPFVGNSTAQVVSAILTETPKPIGELRDGISEPLQSAVMRCLEKDPNERWQSAQDLVAELERLATPSGGFAPASGWKAPGKRPRIVSVFGAAAVALALLGVWYVGGRGGEREDWARSQGIPKIQELLDERNWEGAFALAKEVEAVLGNDPALAGLWASFSEEVTIETTQPGATVWRRPYASSEEDWQQLGVTPIPGIRIPSVYSRFRIELPGHNPMLLAQPAVGFAGGPITMTPLGEVPEDMVHVPAGNASIPNYANATMGLGPFLIDRHEVTNRDYRTFVEAGGYDDPTYWDTLFVLDGIEVSWREAMDRFVDRTGRPGPATWEAGDFPDGFESHPVQGISWFEARAYSRFADKDLPTAFHWHRAAQVNRASFVVPESNFGSDGTAPVGQYQGLTGWGTYDMAGNVREWVVNASGTNRFILGGAWNDYTYFFPVVNAVNPWNRSEKNGVRLVKYLDDSNLAETSRGLDLSYRDYRVEQPVTDETFEAFKTSYAYDPEPIDAVLTLADTAEDWIVQEWSFDAAYEEDRVLANLYLPRVGSPPYQVVVYMPGSGAITSGQTLSDFRQTFRLDFLLKTGRAVIFPCYDGALDRRDPDLTTSRASETYRHAEYTAHWVKDLRRSIDFLETLPGIDADRIGYWGSSWGGRLGAIMLSMEPRLKVGVLNLGGFRPERALPVADDINFVPRVRSPVLMINGREDHLRPYEASQLPFFQLLGTAPEHKEHKVFPGGHFVPRADMIRETLTWLDRYLGPAR